MSKIKKDEVKKPIKNYFILLSIVIATILITIYICKWISIYKEDELSMSPLKDKVNELSLDELNESIVETNEAIIYFGYTMDEDVHSLEEKMVNEIEKRNIKEYIYYIDVKDYLDDKKYESIIKKSFTDLKDKDLKAPLLIYSKRGVPIKVISNASIKDFNNLVNLLETE